MSVFTALFTRVVPAHTAAVEYRDGVITRVLPSGRHRKRWGARVQRVDLRESLLAISPQEILTADAVSVKVSATVRWAVSDPVEYLERTTDPVGVVYLAAQVALRDALSGVSLEDVLTRSGAGVRSGGAVLSADAITAATAAVGATVGIDVREVIVKDVIVPAELRSAALEMATARARGAAQLEMARAETAAIRSLANGARLLDASPALAQLRMLQALPYGAQVVLKVGSEVGRGTEVTD